MTVCCKTYQKSVYLSEHILQYRMQNPIVKNIEVLFAFDSDGILKHEKSVKLAEVIVSLSYAQFLLFTEISSDTFLSQEQAVLFAL